MDKDFILTLYKQQIYYSVIYKMFIHQSIVQPQNDEILEMVSDIIYTYATEYIKKIKYKILKGCVIII